MCSVQEGNLHGCAQVFTLGPGTTGPLNLSLLLVNNYLPDLFHRRQQEHPISDSFPKRVGCSPLIWLYLAFGNDA